MLYLQVHFSLHFLHEIPGEPDHRAYHSQTRHCYSGLSVDETILPNGENVMETENKSVGK